MAMAERDAVVIGAGHNGLVAANYLAKAGLRVLVVERSERVGGACVTDEIAPGFKVSAAAYVSGLFRPQIIEDLELAKFGLRQVAFDPQGFCPFPNGRHLLLWSDGKKTAKEIAKFSKKDAAAYPKYEAMWAEVYDLVEPMLLAPPVPIAELVSLLRGPEAEDLLRRLLFYSAEELLDEYFESDQVKAAFANESVIGHFSGPSAPGTAFTLAHNLLGNIDGAVGVRLEGGRTIDAKVVVSTADPKRTFLQMLDPDQLPAEFRRSVGAIKMHGAAMKVNCALSELPCWNAADGTPGPQHRGSTYIGPSIGYVEDAFLDAKYGQPSEHPWLEVVTQSVLDPSVAPRGKHTLSIYVQYSPYHLASGSWDELKEPYGDRVVETLAEYAPNVPKAILARDVVTPLDLERRFGLTEAH